MRKLDRDPVAPAGLTKYRYGTHQWSGHTPTAPEKSAIWAKLYIMQGGRCAYCEADLSKSRHIEHFRQRHSYPQGTFEWSNLFGSCNRPDSCGKHKDQCAPYNFTDLIKPDSEDPERLLVFTVTGAVQARANINDIDGRKAEETIRILNLNGTLRQIRRAVLLAYAETAEVFAMLAAEHGDAEVLPMLEEELQAIAKLPMQQRSNIY